MERQKCDDKVKTVHMPQTTTHYLYRKISSFCKHHDNMLNSVTHNNAQPWTPIDVNAECMPTNNKPPEPDLQQVAKSMISS